MSFTVTLEYTDGECQDFPFFGAVAAREFYRRAKNRKDVVSVRLRDPVAKLPEKS